jgi:hypothetical protein
MDAIARNVSKALRAVNNELDTCYCKLVVGVVLRLR